MEWTGKRVFVTGHTGFKGSWLALWLHSLGAEVYGYALAPPTRPNLFTVAKVGRVLAADTRADIGNLSCLQRKLFAARPEVVFHLAAQPLVLESYRSPLLTLSTNILGTANLLEAVREVPSVKAVVVVTTDKVYTSGPGFHQETDPLGGDDPYSASKAAAELVVAAYRRSFFTNGARIATARAGNVIGGGDWAANRLIPDCIRAFTEGQKVILRYPDAVRPWQHVLEPLAGYLRLAERLCAEDGERFAKAWNFGSDVPATIDATVGEVAEIAARLWGRGGWKVDCSSPIPPCAESPALRLDSSLARRELGWRPRWTLGQALERTVGWYKAYWARKDMYQFTLDQIKDYA